MILIWGEYSGIQEGSKCNLKYLYNREPKKDLMTEEKVM